MDNHNICPLVSVAVPVYNHEKYIEKALEGALGQKTTFEFEIVVGDDFSTDGTRNILERFKKLYPDKIFLVLQNSNQGVVRNSSDIYKNCRGKYIAMLEGDDYWSYEYKLQKQVDFLEQNEDYIGCFHDAQINIIAGNDFGIINLNFAGFRFYSQLNKYSPDFYSWDIIERNIIPTASLVFRNNKNITVFFEKFADIKLSLIWAFQIFIVGEGKLKYFNDVWCVYNDHPQGISKQQPLNTFKQSNIKVLKRFAKEKYLKHKRNSIYKTITNEYRQILLNPLTYQQNKTFYYKTLTQYFFSYIKTIRFELSNIFEYKKNQGN